MRNNGYGHIIVNILKSKFWSFISLISDSSWCAFSASLLFLNSRDVRITMSPMAVYIIHAQNDMYHGGRTLIPISVLHRSLTSCFDLRRVYDLNFKLWGQSAANWKNGPVFETFAQKLRLVSIYYLPTFKFCRLTFLKFK